MIMTSKSSYGRSLKRTVCYNENDTNDLTVNVGMRIVMKLVVLCYSDFVRSVPLTFVLNVAV